MVWLTGRLDMTRAVDWDVKPQNKCYFDVFLEWIVSKGREDLLMN